MLFIHEFHFHISHISHHILLEFLRNCLFFFFLILCMKASIYPITSQVHVVLASPEAAPICFVAQSWADLRFGPPMWGHS